FYYVIMLNLQRTFMCLSVHHITNFGTMLKDLRTKSGMTQKQLAAQIGVTKSVISFYELHERTPSPEVLYMLFLLCLSMNNI
ncbi:MAG: helix-turn-helix domain-containing protein, partial [Clostridiales bacterium]|nr:helix-turn-helix domain-containing protein [Clostridiales bacterium]